MTSVGANVRKQMHGVEKQSLGDSVQSVMYLFTQVGRERVEFWEGRRRTADQTRADNEEVNKRNGTWKCSPNKPGPTI